MLPSRTGEARLSLITAHRMDARTPGSLLKQPGAEGLLRRLWRDHLARHRGRLITILILTAVMAGLTGLYPVVIDRAFSMFAARDRRILYQVPALVVVITAAKAATTYGQIVLTQGLVLRIIRELQARMFVHLASADLARVERESPAQLAARFTTDAAIIREALTRAIGGIANAITVVGLVASMLWLDWVLSLIAAALYPLAALPIQRLGKRIRRASGGMQEKMGEAASLLTESFAQARNVRAYRLEGIEAARANRSFGDLNRALMRMTRTRSAVDPMLEVLGGVAIAAVMGFAGWRAAVGTNTVGNFTGFVAALLIASQPLRALGSLNAAVQEGMAGLARVFSVIDEPPGITERPGATALPPGSGRVVFEGVRFTYPDGREGLRGLSFVAEPGMTIALVGASGAGKSTALALIPRLHDATGGAITVDGMDVREVTLASLRDAIAYVGQDTTLFDISVGANIALGRPGATVEQITPRRPKPRPPGSSPTCQMGSIWPSARAAAGCRADSGSAWRWPGRCCATRGSCCWTRRPPPWMRRARRRCKRRSPGCGMAAPPSSSPTGYRPCGTPIWWSRWRRASLSSRARTRN